MQSIGADTQSHTQNSPSNTPIQSHPVHTLFLRTLYPLSLGSLSYCFTILLIYYFSRDSLGRLLDATWQITYSCHVSGDTIIGGINPNDLIPVRNSRYPTCASPPRVHKHTHIHTYTCPRTHTHTYTHRRVRVRAHPCAHTHMRFQQTHTHICA